MTIRADRLRVVVTGGAGGLGAAVVDAVRAEGGLAVVLDWRRSDDDFAYQVDVSDSGAVDSAVAWAVSRMGGIDAVVTAAGIDRPGRIDALPTQMWEAVIAVNLVGTANAVRSCLSHLEQSGGRIVTVASTLGLRGVADATAYCASQFGVIGLTRALAVELRGRVAVTAIIPGGMSTPFFDGRDPEHAPEDLDSLADPKDMAAAILFVMKQRPDFQLSEIVAASHPDRSTRDA